MRLTQAQVEEMVGHARREAPREACGILAGREGIVLEVHRVPNIRPDTVTYEMEPKEQNRIVLDLDNRQLELLAIYHSHPASAAYPSPTDVGIALRTWPDPIYVIISLAPDPPDVRGFRLEEESIEEVELEVE